MTTASFFFHHQGTNLQKSFKGLLRSLVSQILEQEMTLSCLLYPILAEQYRTTIAPLDLDNLENDIWALLDHCGVPCSSRVTNDVEKTISLERELTKGRRLGLYLTRLLEDLEVKLGLQAEIPLENDGCDNIEAIMDTETESRSNQKQGVFYQRTGSTRWTPTLIGILKRHYRREKIKTRIQAQQWSRENLEDGLRRLIGQSLFKMDLFLFLDALDEYNGRPEFIASFVQNLVQQSAETSTNSLTRIRILFSSRPWKILNDEFAACPGFQIHDHTWNDIIDFCAASIPSDDTANLFLSPLVMEIVRRARGVFLWVKLVMRDLTQTVSQRLRLRDTQGLKEELRKTLEGIPDELEDYYQVIVQRLSSGMRRESYVVLETLCRSDQDIDTQTLLGILRCWSATSLTDAKRKLLSDPRLSLQGAGLTQAERYIEVVTGGLVEVCDFTVKGKQLVQFIHQTVKQFIVGPWFKFQLLGNSGVFITENGHCFISKYLFTKSLLDDRFFYHAREAETTTGFSQYDFFSTAPTKHVTGSCINDSRIQSSITMAILKGLKLYIRDAYEADRQCIRRDSAEIVSILLNAADTTQTKDTITEMFNMAEMLVTKGLSIDGSDGNLKWIARGLLNPVMEDMAVILVDAIQCPRPSAGVSFSRSESRQPTTVLGSQHVTELLHVSTPKLVRALLSRGVDPNCLDDGRNTPIDSVLARHKSLIQQYDIVSELFYHGGVLASTRRSQWEKWESKCAGSGLDVSIFREAGFPIWKKQGSLRYHLSRRLL